MFPPMTSAPRVVSSLGVSAGSGQGSQLVASQAYSVTTAPGFRSRTRSKSAR